MCFSSVCHLIPLNSWLARFPVLRRRRPLERGEGEEERVLGGVDDQVAHLAAVGPDLGRKLVRAVEDRHVVEGAAGREKEGGRGFSTCTCRKV